MSQILLVDNEAHTLKILSNLLRTEGYSVEAVSDIEKAKEFLKSGAPSVVVSAVGSAWDPEMDVLCRSRAEQPKVRTIALLSDDSQDIALKVEAFKPYAVLRKPLKLDRLLAAVQKAVDYSDEFFSDSVDLNLQLETCYAFEDIVAESPAMKSVCELIRRIAATNVTVLIWGEEGTGKAIFANSIHGTSPRGGKQMVTVDCRSQNARSALIGDASNPGAIRQSDGSTLFLKEIWGLNAETQAILAQALLKKAHPSAGASAPKMDLRVVASTQKDLEQLAGANQFDPELLRLLKIIVIRIPPLRQRREDIMPSFRKTLQKKAGQGGVLPNIDSTVLPLIERYSWPGNLKEMDGVAEYAMRHVKDGRVALDSLPAAVLSARPA